MENKNIGQRIRELRTSHEMTTDELAELLNISASFVGLLERGDRDVSLPIVVAISKIFDASLDYLVFGDESGESND